MTYAGHVADKGWTPLIPGSLDPEPAAPQCTVKITQRINGCQGQPCALPAVQETQVRSLGWEDLLEEGMATHASILAQRIPWIEEPGGLQSIGLQRVRQD